MEQRAFVKGYQRFEIRPDGDLDFSFKRLSTTRQFRMPLWQIVPKPERHKRTDAGSIVGMIIFGLMTLWAICGIIASLRSSNDKDIAVVLLIPLVFLGTLFGMAFWRFMTRSVDAAIFYFRNGGQIHIWFEKPDVAGFKAFCETLSKKSEEAWNNRPVEPDSQSLAGEIAALKRLNSSGVLSNAEFERAKAKLLEQPQEKRIGFLN